MRRRHKIEATIVSSIVASPFAFLVYQLRFNRRFLYDQARVLYDQKQYNRALSHYVRFLRRYPKGKYVREGRQTLSCDQLPAMGQAIDRRYIALAFEALEDNEPLVISEEEIMNGQFSLLVVANARESGKFFSRSWMGTEDGILCNESQLSELKEEAGTLGKGNSSAGSPPCLVPVEP